MIKVRPGLQPPPRHPVRSRLASSLGSRTGSIVVGSESLAAQGRKTRPAAPTPRSPGGRKSVQATAWNRTHTTRRPEKGSGDSLEPHSHYQAAGKGSGDSLEHSHYQAAGLSLSPILTRRPENGSGDSLEPHSHYQAVRGWRQLGTALTLPGGRKRGAEGLRRQLGTALTLPGGQKTGLAGEAQKKTGPDVYSYGTRGAGFSCGNEASRGILTAWG